MEGYWPDAPEQLLMRSTRLAAVTFLVSSAVVVFVGPSFADAGGPVNCQPGRPGCIVGVTDPGSPGQPVSDPQPPPGGGEACSPPTGPGIPQGLDCSGCLWQQIPETPTQLALLGAAPGSTVYQVLCYTAGVSGPTSTNTVVLPPGASPPAPGLSAATLGAQAVAKLPFPTVAAASAPGAQGRPFPQTYVNFPTFLWVDNAQWVVLSATANDGFKSVTATATPQYVTWGMGDGHQIICNGPGVAWHTGIESSYCSYTYATSSAHQPQVGTDVNDRPYTVSTRVTYQVTWTCTGQCGGQDAGTVGAVNGPTTSSPLVVGEIQTVVTG